MYITIIVILLPLFQLFELIQLFQLKFQPNEIKHGTLRSMAKYVTSAMLPECEIFKIALQEGPRHKRIHLTSFRI